MTPVLKSGKSTAWGINMDMISRVPSRILLLLENFIFYFDRTSIAPKRKGKMEATKVSNTDDGQRQEEVSLYKLWEQEETMSKKVAENLLEEGEKGLREVLAIPPDRRDEDGDIHEAADIFKYVSSDISKEVYGSDVTYKIPDELAKLILNDATAEAVEVLVRGLNR